MQIFRVVYLAETVNKLTSINLDSTSIKNSLYCLIILRMLFINIKSYETTNN